jgi:integrase/recombinase XerD
LYLNAEERAVFIEAANNAKRDVRTFCLVLAYTGWRISEAPALTPKIFDFSWRAIVFETSKKRRSGVYRADPMPQNTLDTIDMEWRGARQEFVTQ